MSVILAIDLGKYNQIPNSLSHTTPTPRRRRSAPFAPGRPSSARTCCDSPLSVVYVPFLETEGETSVTLNCQQTKFLGWPG